MLKNRIAVSVFYFVSGFNFATWVSRITTLQEKLQLTYAKLGSLLSAIPLGIMLTMPLAGFVLVKFKSRHVLLVSALLYTTLLSISTYINNWWQLFILLFLFGAVRNFFNTSLNTQSLLIQQESKNSVLTRFHAVWSLAALLGTGVSFLALQYQLTIQQHFFIVSLASLLCIVLFYKHTHDGNKQSQHYVFMWPNKLLLKLGLIGFVAMLCESTMSDWSSNYFLQVLHLPSAYAVAGYAVYVSSVLIGRFSGDYLINKFGIYKLMLASCLLFCAGFTTAALTANAILVVLAFLSIGLGLSCIMPSLFGLVAKLSKHPPGISVATVSTLSYAGFLVGPVIIGQLSHYFNIRTSFLFLSGMALLIVFFIPFALKKYLVK